MINNTELDNILKALKLAADEAEGLYGGLSDTEKIESLRPCYKILEEFGILTEREEKRLQTLK